MKKARISPADGLQLLAVQHHQQRIGQGEAKNQFIVTDDLLERPTPFDLEALMPMHAGHDQTERIAVAADLDNRHQIHFLLTVLLRMQQVQDVEQLVYPSFCKFSLGC